MQMFHLRRDVMDVEVDVDIEKLLYWDIGQWWSLVELSWSVSVVR